MSSAIPDGLNIDLIRSILLADTAAAIAASRSTSFDSSPCPIYGQLIRNDDNNESNVNINNSNEARDHSSSSTGVVAEDSVEHVHINIPGRQNNPENNARREDIEKDLDFSPYYFVARQGRNLKRSEVLGFGFLTMAIMCILLVAVIGLEALGYSKTGEPLIFPEYSDVDRHQVRSFSWRVLSEFFISDAISGYEKDCLYFNKKRHIYRRRIGGRHYESPTNSDLGHNDKEFDFDKFDTMSYEDLMKTDSSSTSSPQPIDQHISKCDDSRINDGWSWLCRYMLSMFLPLLNLGCASILLSSVGCRRRKGLQFSLMIPAFLCVFLDIFQQIPMIFQYTYTGMVLTEDMQNSLALTIPPLKISPIWEETQIHGQCCGINSPETWYLHGYDAFPKSCCNTTAHECDQGFPTRSKVWNRGCYDQEYTKIRNYEFLSVVVLFLKLVAEMGILWSLSDISRFEYPNPEFILNSTCDVKDFEVRTFGCAKILGVTEQPKMAIKLRKRNANRYRLSTTQAGALKTVVIKSHFKTVGSIEIRRQRHNRSSENATVDLNRGRNYGLLFLMF